MSRYSAAVANGRPGREVVDEFKLLVRECHRRGIEVILDVVFNHTAEGNEKGPTLSFRWGGGAVLVQADEGCVSLGRCWLPLCCAGSVRLCCAGSRAPGTVPCDLGATQLTLPVQGGHCTALVLRCSHFCCAPIATGAWTTACTT